MKLWPSLFLSLIAISVGACGTLGSHEVGGRSPSIRTALLANAKRFAAFEGDPHPYDIEAVRTTARKAEQLSGGQASIPPPNSLVYVVAMRGHFRCADCSHPAGATNPPASVATFTILAKTMRVFEEDLGNRYPDLRHAGTPFHL